MNKDKVIFYESLLYPTLFVVLLWGIKIIQYLYGLNLVVFGILPRNFYGLIGIATAPLIHGSFQHLFSNSLPLLILGIMTFYFYRKIAFEIFFWVYILTGVWVWTSASDNGFHIGASGIIYGFASFLVFSGVFRKERKSLLLSLIVILVYGGLIWGILPTSNDYSWESHFFGALSGGFAAFFYRKEDVRHQSKPVNSIGSQPTNEGDSIQNN